MRTVADSNSRQQDPDLMGWTSGPLPVQDLEQIAFAIFQFRYPRSSYDDPLFKEERNDCRALTLKLRAKFLRAERWTIHNAVEQLTDASCQLLFGDHLVNTKTRGEIQDYAESYIEDLNKLFGGADRRVAVGSESWRYVPEEDDRSELEVMPVKGIQ